MNFKNNFKLQTITIPSFLLTDKNLDGNSLRILLFLFDNYSEFTLKIEEISEKLGLSEKTVIEKIKDLENLGYIRKSKRFDEKGKMVGNDYEIGFIETYSEKEKVVFIEKKEKKKKVIPSLDMTIIEDLDIESQELFCEYIELRNKMKILTNNSILKSLVKIYKDNGCEKEMIRISINSNYKTLFPIRKQQFKNKTLVDIEDKVYV